MTLVPKGKREPFSNSSYYAALEGDSSSGYVGCTPGESDGGSAVGGGSTTGALDSGQPSGNLDNIGLGDNNLTEEQATVAGNKKSIGGGGKNVKIKSLGASGVGANDAQTDVGSKSNNSKSGGALSSGESGTKAYAKLKKASRAFLKKHPKIAAN